MTTEQDITNDPFNTLLNDSLLPNSTNSLSTLTPIEYDLLQIKLEILLDHSQQLQQKINFVTSILNTTQSSNRQIITQLNHQKLNSNDIKAQYMLGKKLLQQSNLLSNSSTEYKEFYQDIFNYINKELKYIKEYHHQNNTAIQTLISTQTFLIKY